MTDEELEALQQQITDRIKSLPATPDEQLTLKERRYRRVLRAKQQVLARIQKAREQGNINQEVKAGLDYAVLDKYGERNIFLYNLMKARQIWWRGI